MEKVIKEKNLQIKSIAQFSSQGRFSTQEDFVVVDKNRGILVLADGFGGAQPGAGAAKTSCESVRSFLFKEAGDLEATLPFILRGYFSLAGNVLFNALIHANRQVMKLNKAKNVNEKGGASVVSAFIDGDLLAIANVGCCRAWLVRDKNPVELVIPRSLGRLKNVFAPDERPEQQVPLIALGMSEDLEPEIFEYRIRPGDWVILASDGIVNSALPSEAASSLAARTERHPALISKLALLQQNEFSEAILTQAKALFGAEEFNENASLCLAAL